MVVDDAAIVRNTLKDILLKNNFEVVAEAENGHVAVKKYKEFTPDLVIMDITMPVMNGIDATKEIKKINQEAKILICSVMGQKKMVIEAFLAGAEDFLVKPYKKESVLEKVAKYLK